MAEARALAVERLAPARDTLAADASRGAIAGAVVLVCHRDEAVWFEAFGLEDPGEPSRPMRRSTVFRIAAMSRPLVAAAALSLAQEGQLRLADPVCEYLPEFAHVEVGCEEAVKEGGKKEGPRLVRHAPRRAMTVLDLLRHTSGLTYGMFGDSAVQRLYREAGVMEPGQSNAEMARKLALLPLQCHPGEQFEYGMSTDLLGRVLEVVSGHALGRVIAERITGPLGMRDTGFRLREGARLARPRTGPGAPTAVLFDFDPACPPAWQSGGAGLLSTAADYARFCRMLLAGGTLDGARVLDARSVDWMLADQLPRGIGFGTSTEGLGINAPLPRLGQGHGLGVGVRTHAGLAPVPGSIGDFFWGGALGTYFWADPGERLVAVLMLQENDVAVRGRYRALLRHAVYGALA
ncbi:MAG TPA: serine hydrolase domain-containing protein [Ramlibacter sp.]|uniref:serine hydrolase domain-containing protein n=1 Tax=Ramlibacter sp. TaxID=1917967 RepID=UPI002BA3E5A7|nr:serine hydrolase domain-containing protein [Ramlibacter sp.]HVZ45909.1 serine hydrolase domain-containing protein [Ramlibacter sp.]